MLDSRSTSTPRSARRTGSSRRVPATTATPKVRGYHPLLAVAADTGEVLMARLHEGRANTARGAAHFLHETIGRVRSAGATGQIMVRTDSGFHAHAVVAVCRALGVRFSITIRQRRSVHRLIEAIPEDAWTPIPYWIEGGDDVGRDELHTRCGRAGRRPRPPDRAPGAARRRPIVTARTLRRPLFGLVGRLTRSARRETRARPHAAPGAPAARLTAR